MPLPKTAQSIIVTIESAIKRSQEFLDAVKAGGESGFNDNALRLALELAKYADYIKLSLIMYNAAAASAPAPAVPKRALTAQEQAQMQGASEEEKALVEHTPPPGFNA